MSGTLVMATEPGIERAQCAAIIDVVKIIAVAALDQAPLAAAMPSGGVMS